jgi:hypothetical protein
MLLLPAPPRSGHRDQYLSFSETRRAERIQRGRGLVPPRLVLRAGLALILLQLACPAYGPAAGALVRTDQAAPPVAVNWGSGPSPGNTFPSQNPSVSRGGALAPVAVNWGSSPARAATVTLDG